MEIHDIFGQFCIGCPVGNYPVHSLPCIQFVLSALKLIPTKADGMLIYQQHNNFP